MAEAVFGTSGQVMAEFYAAVTSARHRMPEAEARAWLDVLAERPFVPVDTSLVIAGASHAERYRISYWDGAIIAAAERLGATVLYTEDLNSGQIYGSVRAVNPFREVA